MGSAQRGYAAFFSFVDEHGYVRSFNIDDDQTTVDWTAIDDFFSLHGFVVISNSFDTSDIDATVAEFWKLMSINSLAEGTGFIDQNKPETWDDSRWVGCQSAKAPTRGFIEADIQSMQLVNFWNNQQNSKIILLFQHLLASDRIYIVDEGRFGSMRPTKDIQFSDGSVVDKPEWRTQANWLHWDQNPWDQPNFHGLQGILALTDHTLESGGFVCIPGFHKEFSEWASQTDRSMVKSNQSSIVYVPDDAKHIHARAVPIPMRKGDLLVWDSRLPHCNYPNAGPQFRICQYITYATLSHENLQLQANLLQLKMAMVSEENLSRTLTPLGRQIMGLDQVEPFTEQDKTAAKILKEARELEANGDITGATRLYDKAFKLSPLVESLS